MRVGLGYDAHRLERGLALWLCGVRVESEVGALGHSDADAALHAVCDALLGALGLGDIGTHFPDSDPRYKGAASSLFVEGVMELARARGYRVENVDVVIGLERPRLSGYVPMMRARLGSLLGVTEDRVSVKATTTEGLGFVGEGRGVMSQAVVLLREA